jgi:hypothetical protein
MVLNGDSKARDIICIPVASSALSGFYSLVRFLALVERHHHQQQYLLLQLQALRASIINSVFFSFISTSEAAPT